MARNEKAWAEIEKDKNNPQPTPPVGYDVVWFQAGQKKYAAGAKVFKSYGSDDPGRLDLCVFSDKGMQFKSGVYHHSSRHNNGANRQIFDKGTWDYIEGEKPAKEHFNAHKQYVEHRENAQRNAEAMQAETEAKMKAKAAEAVGA